MRLITLSLALIPGLALAAAPTIQNVTDSAGYGPRAAAGSIASVFGADLASGTTSASGYPLLTTMEDASVSVGGVLSPLVYVSPGQIDFQVPSSVKSGDVNVVVKGPGGSSASFSLTVTAQAPAIYQYGTNHAVAQNSDGSLNGDSAAAAAGSVITVYLTGQGVVNNPVTDGDATPLSSSATATATATIGPASAPVQFLGLAPEFAGLAQANIQVPTLPTGDYPLVITLGGFVSASAIVSVSGSGTAYTSPLTLTGSASFANSDTSSIVLYNNVAYVCGEGRIVMVDVTNAAAPTVIGEFGDSVLNGYGDRCVINTTAATPYLVEIVGSAAGSQESFAVYSLSNPQSPTLLAVASTSYGHMVDLSFSGNYGFATTSYVTYQNSNDQVTAQTGDFLVFNFTNPASPQFLTSLQASSGSSNQNLKPYANVVDQVYAYVATTTATGTSTAGTGVLEIISVGSPTVPTPISQVAIPGAAIVLSFDVSGNTLLAAGSTAGQRNPATPDLDFTGYLTLAAVDVTNILTPTVVSSITTQLQVNGTFNTAAFSNGVFAIVNNPPDSDDFGPALLEIVDVRNPSNILLYPYQTQFGFSGILTTNNGYLLAPTSLGLNIYKLQL